MKNLQSKDLPFRTLAEFYQPTIPTRPRQGIKVFPQKQPQANHEGVFSTSPVLPTIMNYLSGLNAAKQLPRRIHNRHQYFSVPKQCDKHCHQDSSRTIVPEGPQDDSQRRKTKQTLRFDTIVSHNITSRSTAYIINHKAAQEKRISADKHNFLSERTIKKEEREKEMRFSFYNTIEKSDYFIRKFKQDNTLSQRRTNKYQNMFRRNIKAEQILTILQKSKQKLLSGFSGY